MSELKNTTTVPVPPINTRLKRRDKKTPRSLAENGKLYPCLLEPFSKGNVHYNYTYAWNGKTNSNFER